MDTINLQQIKDIPSKSTLLIRAHGEPPSTYQKANQANLKIIDYTCPVVLRLQQRIKNSYLKIKPLGGQILIFGKIGHAEVLGLLGQVDNDALVFENMQMLEDFLSLGKLDLSKPISIFAQTTKSPKEFNSVCDFLREKMSAFHNLSSEELIDRQLFNVNNTICSQVSNRHSGLIEFSKSHSIVIFVSGKDSSNGKVLCNLCQSVNPRTYMVGSADRICLDWFRDNDTVGVCGATSTPKWLLEEVANKILSFVEK